MRCASRLSSCPVTSARCALCGRCGSAYTRRRSWVLTGPGGWFAAAAASGAGLAGIVLAGLDTLEVGSACLEEVSASGLVAFVAAAVACLVTPSGLPRVAGSFGFFSFWGAGFKAGAEELL